MKTRVAVLFGGRSAEHEISIITALEVMQALDSSRYYIVPVYVDPKGEWYSGELLFDKSSYPLKGDIKKSLPRVALLPIPGIGGLTRLEFPAVIPVDIYMPVFHGQYGEDGCIQGLFELASVPYTGCDLLHQQ